MEPADVQAVCGPSFLADSSIAATNSFVSGRGQKIDYLLSLSTSGISLSVDSEAISSPVVSDHLPVFGLVRFSQDPR